MDRAFTVARLFPSAARALDVVPVGTSGTRYFGARVDSTSAVSEGNEVNNDDTYDTVTVN